MPTILLVANWPSDVGFAWWLMEGFWARIATHFSKHGYRILIAFPKVNAIPDVVAKAPIEVCEVDVEALTGQPLALMRFIRKERIQHVYFSDWPLWRPIYAVMRAAGVEGIIMHDHTPGARPAARGLRRLLKQILLRGPWSANLCIGATEYVRQRLIDNGCLPPARTRAASNGIEPLPERPAQDARELFGLPDGVPIAISTGRLNPYKRIDLMLQALRLVLDRGVPVHLLVVGDGPARNDLEALRDDLDLAHAVTFVGRRDDIRSFLGSCDIGFHAAVGEVGYSLSILEFMSAGLATLVPNEPAVCEATDHDRTGLTYTTGDVGAAASALERAAADAALRSRLGAEARAEVQARYRLEHTHAALLDALTEVIPER